MLLLKRFIFILIRSSRLAVGVGKQCLLGFNYVCNYLGAVYLVSACRDSFTVFTLRVTQ